jgi:SAM-dependent methyltransferase
MDVQSKINDLWDGASREYDTRPSHGIHDGRHEAAWKDALRALLPRPPADVLDVGTGTGVIALLLADLGYNVRGVDLSAGMLQQARIKAQSAGRDVRFEHGDAMDPGGPSASVDVVISRHVLWTLTDPARALRNWLHLLRPNGRLVIIDGLWASEPDDNDDRLGDITSSLPLMRPSATLDDVTALVERAGFTRVNVSDLAEIDRLERALPEQAHNPPHYVVAAVKPG